MGTIIGVICAALFMFVVLDEDPFLPPLPAMIFVSPLVAAMFIIYKLCDSVLITACSTMALTVVYVIIATNILDNKGKRR